MKKPIWKKGYKVVREFVPNKYISATDDGIRMQYCIGHPTKRLENCGPMGVFVSLAEARLFQKSGIELGIPGVKVAECDYIPSEEKMLWCISTEQRPSYGRVGIKDTSKVNPDIGDTADVIVLTKILDKVAMTDKIVEEKLMEIIEVWDSEHYDNKITWGQAKQNLAQTIIKALPELGYDRVGPECAAESKVTA